MTDEVAGTIAPGNAGRAEMDRKRLMLLEGPILSTTLRLALPTIVILTIQVLLGIVEVYFIGFLGTDALAGVALAFPFIMLMQMISNGGIGAGVSSAVARAVGAGRADRAEALLFNSLILAVVFGLLTTFITLAAGRPLFEAMGGKGAALDAALLYGGVVMGGAVLIWAVNLLTAALRGAGDTTAAAVVTLLGLIVGVPLSPLFIFGLGPIPGLGVIGAALGMIAYYVAALVFVILHCRSSRSPLKLRLDWRQFDPRLIGDVLSVGGLAALGAATPNLAVGLVTGTVGRFGVDAIAGYGLASRLDFTLVPLLFGLGSGIMVMVGANAGAGHWRRAKRAMLLGVLVGAGFAEVVGLVAALWPGLWLGLYSNDGAALATGGLYFTIVGPAFGFKASAMLLSLGAQGAGRAVRPLIAGLTQLTLGSVGGWIAVTQFGAGLSVLYLFVALGIVLAVPPVLTTVRPPKG